VGPPELQIRRLLQGVALVAVDQGVCQCVQVPDDAGRKFEQQGHELVPDPCPQEATIFVGRVHCKRNAVALEVRDDVSATSPQQRPDAVAIASWQHGKPTWPRATQQPQ
jgi:hypothetical protein